MISQSLAKRYVGAVFAVAVEQRLLEKVEEQLVTAQAALQAGPEFARFLKHPLVSAEDKQRMIEVAVGAPLLAPVASFVGLLLAHHRIEVLEAAGGVFQALTDAFAGRARAHVTTAIALSEEQRVRLEAALAKLVGTPVVVDAQVDADVIGGVVVRIGDDTIDGTLRNRLAQIQERMGASG
jgi:F-type H+-transporting ATPase subunit delta